ncbi:hypothetical protein N7460_007384 [Penicillium canescens]|uniref:HAT C-terminal dimerisation domain-containing protein n=1 Tax=Penicillium canescens TaxID=5083 RepID=A0AAD6I9V7_PENCN|nr:hypothetical protein N7460_007384 [Penicillium canescens]
MSQLSDVYPSSSFDTQDGLPLDALQYLIPDDSLSHRQSQSQLPSESQFDSALDLPDNRVQIRTASQAPDTLPRIRPDCINEFIICIPAMSAEFVKWWLHTDYALVAVVQNAGKGFNKLQMPKMESQALYAITAVQFSRIQLRTILERPRCRNISMDQGADSDYRRRAERRPAPTFTQRTWEQKILNLITTSQLPFRFLEHQEFHDILSYARLAPTPPSVPSRKVIRERLRSFVIEYQQETLQRLPSSAKLSLALDCWTSPFQDAFMAITGYFIDQEWEYREVLLGFEPLSGTHSGVNLGEVVLQILQKHQITDRVLAVTTDNASNNKTLIAAVNDSIRELQLKTDSTIIQVPCLAHIIQLSLIDLLGKIKASPKNDTAESVWSDERVRLLRARQQKHKIADTLNKVRGLAVYINGSPQRKEAFLNLQSNGQKLVPIQDAAKDKLSKYYGMTDNVEGDLYTIGTILDPSNKMEFFSTSDWAPDNSGKDYKKEYPGYQQTNQRSRGLVGAISRSHQPVRNTMNLLDIFRVRNHEKEFPILASITRDVMSILATSAGVERLFNSARDVCHYRRGSLNPETEYLLEQEIAATSKELNIEIHCSEAISDTEEDVEMYLDIPAALPLSEVAARKRPAVTFDDEEDANADKFADLEENSLSPLPDTQHRVDLATTLRMGPYPGPSNLPS